MHHPTTSPGIPRSVNVIKGGGTAMPAPDESRQKPGGSQAAPGQQQPRCDETDLLALLKRLGLALSSPSSASRGCGNRNGNRDGDGDEGMACGREEMDTSSPTPAPNNGSYSANGPRGAGPEGASAAEAVGSGSGTAAASRRSQQQQHQQVSERSDAGGRSFDTRQRDVRRGEGAAFGRANEPQSLGRGGGIGNGGRNGDGNDFSGSNSNRSNNNNYQTKDEAWSGGKLKPGNGRVFSGEMAVGKAEAGSGVGNSSSAAATTTTSGGPRAEASPKDGGAIGLRTVAVSEKMVDLMRREITAREALLLGPILRSATGVTCLRLCYNDLKDGGAEAVSSAIESLPSLHSMDLGFNNIGDQGAANLARSLVRNRSLRTLYLSGNSIGAAGATALAESLGRSDGLETLHLSGNCIGPEGASALAEALKSNTSLTRLYIDGAGIKAQGVNAVASALLTNSVLSDLHMSDNEIGDESLEGLGHALRRNSSVRLLELCFNRITGAGAEAFSKSMWGCATLRSLRLDNNQIGNRGAQALAAAMPTLGLETLELGFNNVATAGVASLMQATVNNPTLMSLSLSGNALDGEAAKSIQSALSQPRCPLKRLSLDHTSLAKASEAYIANGVLSNRSLTLVALTGLHLGTAFARLGMPPQVANFSNEQALEQVRLYWAKRLPGTSKGEQRPASDPSRGGNGGGNRNGGTAASPYGATSVASAGSPSSEAARKARQQHLPPRAHGALDERGSRGNPAASTSSEPRPQQARRDQGRSLPTPGPRGTRRVTGDDGEGSGAQAKSVELSTIKSSRISFGVGGGAQGDGPSGRSGGAGDGSNDGDVPVARNPHQLLLDPLREIAQMPFSAANLWSLHQHYFSPPVEPRSPALGAACPPTTSDSITPPMPPIVTAPAAATGYSAPSPSRQQQQQQQGSPATRAGCGVWWLDTISVNGNDSRGREDSEAGVGVYGGGRGGGVGQHHGFSTGVGGVIFNDDGVGAGARRCRRTSSLGGEDDDEVNSPRPPSKRYRNSSAKIRIACFPAIQARISTLKNKSDERGVLTILRQLKFLESGVCDARPASASSAAGGAPASGTASSATGSGSGSGPARVPPRGVFGATPVGAGGRVGGGGGGERGGAGVPPKDAPKTGPLTDAEIERILLEEV